MEMNAAHTNPAYDSPTPDGRDNSNGVNSAGQVNIELGEPTKTTQEQHQEGGGERVVLVGSGDMTRALVTNLIRAGYTPVVATRNPARARTLYHDLVRAKEVKRKISNRTWFTSDEVEVRTVAEGLSLAGDFVVVAIPAQHHSSLPKHLLCNKIVVDISNRNPKDPSKGPSLAEELQDMLPESHVVKAFNTLSAYVLQRPDLSGSRQVPVCGDQVWARARVATLARHLGLAPVDMGGLRKARALEDIPLSFFPEWRLPVILGAAAFIFFFLLDFFRKLCPKLQDDGTPDWSWLADVPLNTFQSSFADSACILLLGCYVPGIIAAYLQLWRGTKYSQFPSWLDNWLKTRKQLGLMALLLGATHGCLGILYKILHGVKLSWDQTTYLACGVLLLAVMVVLGVTSLPSVSSTLSWREFSGVQRYLGWSSVVLLTAHATIRNINFFVRPPVCVVLIHTSQIIVPLCLLTLTLKIPLLLPFMDTHLTKIRQGYERPSHSSSSSTHHHQP